MLISVITPVFNRQDLIRDALKSVVQQDYRPLEVLVVDDGSTDGTADIVKGFDGPVRYIHQQHAGVAAARNRGLAESAGGLIAFLDSDDLWPTKMLSNAAAQLDARPQWAAAHGATVIDRMSSSGTHRRRFEHGVRTHRPLLGSIVFRRACFASVGNFDEQFDSGEDLDWISRAKEMGVEIGRVDELWLRYRVHNGNMTNEIAAATAGMALAAKLVLERRRARRAQ